MSAYEWVLVIALGISVVANVITFYFNIRDEIERRNVMRRYDTTRGWETGEQ